MTFGLLALIFCSATMGLAEEPEKVTVCQLKDDPAAYNHKLLEVTGFVSYGFEEFTLFDPSCASWPEIWLEYGGTLKSGTIYCCGVTPARSRPKQLVVDGIAIPLLNDRDLREFDRLLHRPPDSIVHATLVGRFFSGREAGNPKGAFRGYGHFGCCSLLAIQQIISVDPQNRNDLDYRATPDRPDIEKVGCSYRHLTSFGPYADGIEAQKRAELGQPDRAFDDPQRVASHALAQLLKVDEGSIVGMRLKRKAKGRMVYEWALTGKQTSYMVVVSRPYWLQFYSKDANRVAWIVVAGYESSCRG